MCSKLRNSLIEALLVVGADSDSGLKLQRDEPGLDMPIGLSDESPELAKLFRYAYDPRVIAILLHDKAVFPFWELQTDYRYPPLGYRRRTKKSTADSPGDSRLIGRRNSKSHKPSSLLSEQQADVRRRSTRKQSTKKAESSCSSEFIDNMPPFCFPDRMRVYSQPQEPNVHYFIRTEVSGARYYVVCYTYTQRYYATLQHAERASIRLFRGIPEEDIDSSQSSNSSDDVSTATKTKKFVECYVPHCIAVISSQTYFGTLKSILTVLGNQLELEDSDFKLCLEKAAFQLFSTCIPPDTNTSLQFRFMNHVFKLRPPNFGRMRSALDFDLHVIMSCMSIESLITLYESVLTEQKIVLFSASNALLTMICQTVFEIIYPFKWPHVCVPILPSFLLELLDAPNAYIMGCNVEKKQTVQSTLHDAICFDLDTGSVAIGRDLQPLPKLPELARQMLLDGLSSVQFDYYRNCLARKDHFTLDEFVNDKVRFVEAAKRKILSTFARVFMQLFSDVETYSMREQRFFNKQTFLKNRPPGTQPFYEAVIDTTLFTAYLKDRWSGEHEPYATISRQLQSRAQTLGGVRDKRKPSSAPVVIIPELPDMFTDQNGEIVVELPNFNYDEELRVKPPSTDNANGSPTAVSADEKKKKQPNRKSIAAMLQKSKNTNDSEDAQTQDENDGSKLYHERCIEHFTTLLDSLKESNQDNLAQRKHIENLKAFLFFNRALYQLSLQKINDCLKDLDEVALLNRALVQKEMVEQIWLGMRPAERVKILESENFRQQFCHICDMLEPMSRGSVTVVAGALAEIPEDNDNEEMQPITITPDPMTTSPFADQRIRTSRSLPTSPVQFDEFCRLMQIFDITSDQDLLERFFDVLTISERKYLSVKLPRQSHLQPDLLQMFIEKWRANEALTHDACDPASLQSNESVLKVSGLCKSDRGTGRLILTENRLLFLPEGRTTCNQICLLKSATAVERSQKTYLLMMIPELKVTYRVEAGQTEVFRILLKNERDSWLFLINEMIAGHWLASQTMDRSLVHQAAETVLIMDALIDMCREDLCPLHDHLEQVVQEMSFFTESKRQSEREQSIAAKNRQSVYEAQTSGVYLRHRISPNAFSERRAVDVLLYVPAFHEEEPETSDIVVHEDGRTEPGTSTSTLRSVVKPELGQTASDTERMPKLWVALNGSLSRKVVVYDASTWVLEYDGSNQRFNNRVTAMVYVKSVDQVWVASSDKHIYVICARTYVTQRVFSDHNDQIGSMVCFFVHERDSSATHERIVSATVSGELLYWYATSTKPERRVALTAQLSITGLWYSSDNRLWCKVTTNRHKDEILVISLPSWELIKRVCASPLLGKDHTDSNYDRIGAFALVTADGRSASARKSADPPESVWIALRDHPCLTKYDARTYEQLEIFEMRLSTGEKVRGCCSMACLNNKLWIGANTGDLLIFNMETMQLENVVFGVHPDTATRSVVTADDLYVLTGGGSADGKIAIWKPARRCSRKPD